MSIDPKPFYNYNMFCICKGCPNYAFYTAKGHNEPLLCYDHKSPNSITTDIICIRQRCIFAADYNYAGKKFPLYCGKHKLKEMINLSEGTKCRGLSGQCPKIARYSYKGNLLPLFCYNHKLENMVIINKSHCYYNDCLKKRTCGYDKPLFCNDHKLKGMEYVKSRLCKEPGCKKLPSFCMPNRKTGHYCLEHAKDGMVSAKSVKCIAYYCDNFTLNVFCKDCIQAMSLDLVL